MSELNSTFSIAQNVDCSPADAKLLKLPLLIWLYFKCSTNLEEILCISTHNVPVGFVWVDLMPFSTFPTLSR